jgi:hypothetical protein
MWNQLVGGIHSLTCSFTQIEALIQKYITDSLLSARKEETMKKKPMFSSSWNLKNILGRSAWQKSQEQGKNEHVK